MATKKEVEKSAEVTPLFASKTLNDQYIDLRNCNNASQDVKLVRSLGFLKNPFDCMSDILWFKETDDFSLITYDPDGIEISREDVVSNLALAQTTAGDGSIGWAKEIGIQAQWQSKVLQFITSVNASEKINGKEGQTIIAYANGGVWMKDEVIFNQGKEDEFIVSMVYPNLKLEGWINPMSGNQTAETEHTLAIKVEDWPLTEFGGTAPVGFAIPKGMTPIEITYTDVTLTSSTLTFTGLNLADSNAIPLIDIDITEPITISVYDDATGELLVDKQTFPETNATAVISGDFPNGSYKISIGYVMDTNLYIPYETFPVSLI